MTQKKNNWHPLPYNDWKKTLDTIHLFSQIIGKIRLALMPMQVEWAQIPFRLTSRGMTSDRMPVNFGSLDITFDFITHDLFLHASNGRSISFPLSGKSVSGFYSEVFEALKELGIETEINPMSVEMKVPVKMDTDEEHKTYDEIAVRRWWEVLILAGNVFNKFRSRFSGKMSPVNMWWGSFDLSITFFSIGQINTQPGMDLLNRVAMDTGQITIGFWPGSDDFPEPAFFGYTYPKPEGYEKSLMNPNEAFWSDEKGEFFLKYEIVRNSPDPEKTLTEFCKSIFESGVELSGWDKEACEYKPPLEKP
ncbi:MAG TPA: DUF5996 family protein [Ignavibacteria bacterium]|nr:DUF5996 family protein [Ignavibacteria bacterium]HMR41246.1 DUF5996 family protein [Ignavibacteria bacterium]